MFLRSFFWFLDSWGVLRCENFHFLEQLLLQSFLIRFETITAQKCPYSELFWPAFCCIRTEYGEIRSICLYSVRMRENPDQNDSKYRNFFRSVLHSKVHSGPHQTSMIKSFAKIVNIFQPLTIFATIIPTGITCCKSAL